MPPARSVSLGVLRKRNIKVMRNGHDVILQACVMYLGITVDQLLSGEVIAERILQVSVKLFLNSISSCIA